MTRVATPPWASHCDVLLDRMRLSDYEAIRTHREQMLAVVDREVRRYMSTPGLSGDGDPDMFPDRACMSGEYYVTSESYTGNQPDAARVQVAVMCHCLEKPSAPTEESSDYLGLEVWLSWSREQPKAFEIFRDTDSSSI